MENKKLIAKTMNVLELIAQLDEFHNMGIDYIDIYGEKGEEYDELIFAFNKEYMNPVARANFEETFKHIIDEQGNVDSTKLSDDDLNNELGGA